MPESWVDDLLAAAPRPTPEFRERLRQDVIASWRGEALTTLSAPQRGGRRWPLLLAAAIVAALIAGLVAAAATGGLLGDDRPADEPPPPPPTSRPGATTPDGMIAFVGGDDLPSCRVARPCVEPNEIYVVRPDGAGLKAVTSSPDDMVYAPAWSPSGDRLAYLRKDWARLVIVDPSTSRETLSVKDPARIGDETRWTEWSSLEWSPDGRWIIVDMVGSRRGIAGGSFSIVDVETGDTTTVNGYNGLRWSPDGRWMALYADDEVLVVPTADVDVSDLADDAAGLAGARVFPVEGSLLELTSPAWAPDGSAFALTVTPGDDWNPHVEVVSVADGSRRTVADQGLSPAWSPDGRHIAYLDSRERAWVTGVDGSDTRQVATSLIPPVWSPDSSSLMVLDQDGLYSINLDTNSKTRLSPPELGPDRDQADHLKSENHSRWNGWFGNFGPDWQALPQTSSEEDSSSNG
jgi:WD40-like Beta Propeller Repeat